MNLYKETLSDDQLKEEKQFSDLLDQIKLGRKGISLIYGEEKNIASLHPGSLINVFF